MNQDEAKRALSERAPARAAWGYPHDLSSTRAIGRVIGYSAKPMILIETDDGEQVWWAAELVESVDAGVVMSTTEPHRTPSNGSDSRSDQA